MTDSAYRACSVSSPGQRCDDRLQRVGIGRVELRALGLGIRGVALRERLDERAVLFRGAPGQRRRLRERGQRRRIRLRHHRHVDVGAEHERLAPEAQGAGRIELLRRLEGALRLGMVEREGEPQSLVEVGLRLRHAGADPERLLAEALEERHVAAGRLHRGRLERRGLGLGEDERLEQRGLAAARGAAQAAGAVEQRVVGRGRGSGGHGTGRERGDAREGAGDEGVEEAADRGASGSVHGGLLSGGGTRPGRTGRGQECYCSRNIAATGARRPAGCENVASRHPPCVPPKCPSSSSPKSRSPTATCRSSTTPAS